MAVTEGTVLLTLACVIDAVLLLKGERMKLIKILPFILTIAVMTVIFVFSSQSRADSADLSEGLTVKIVNTVPVIKDKPPEVKKQIVKDIHNCIRKSAHFLLFSLLGISSYLMFIVMKYGSCEQKKWLYAIIFCALYASFDEIHQTFVPGRSGEIGDIILDTAGAMAGSTVFVNLKDIFTGIFKRLKNT